MRKRERPKLLVIKEKEHDLDLQPPTSLVYFISASSKLDEATRYSSSLFSRYPLIIGHLSWIFPCSIFYVFK